MSKKIKVLSSAEGYNLAADYYDEKEKYLNSFEQGKILPMLGDVTNKKVLDVGAGTGRLAVYLANRGAEVTALDISGKMLEMIKRKHKKIVTKIGDAENLPFKDSSFDIAVAAFLIVHLKDPRRFFDEVYRVLKDDGIFVVTNINQTDPPLVKTKQGEIIIESFYHRPEKIREILESLAFKIEKETFITQGDDVWINQIIVARK
ncbi:MAG: class I SAM-dependent methyltransferase [Patescibacteria group bacterium]